MANKPKVTRDDVRAVVRESLGLSPVTPKGTGKKLQKARVDESFVVAAQQYNLSTEMLSTKSKRAHQEIFEKYVESVNKISAKLDAVDRDTANSDDSEFRSLKIDEADNLNASFLHAYFFDNISDPHSQITMDSLTFLRLERDFGTFDAWQKDFIACALSARDGWACTVYNGFLNRYMNIIVDLNSSNVPLGCYPVIVLDMWEHAYYRDYLNDKKTYIFAMMKEFDWEIIEERVKKSERLAKVLAR